MSNSKAVRIPSNYNKSKTNLPLPPIVFSLRESARDNAVHVVTFSLREPAGEYNNIFLWWNVNNFIHIIYGKEHFQFCNKLKIIQNITFNLNRYH